MKKINLIGWLSRNSHEKQSPQHFARYAPMLIMLLTLGVGQMWANTYWYAGSSNSWGADAMTVSSGGKYEYIQIAKQGVTLSAKIRASSSDWNTTWGRQYTASGYVGTDVTNMNSSSSSWSENEGEGNADNICIYYTTKAFYIIVFYPNTNVNTTNNPIVCASTTLPDDASYKVYFCNYSSWSGTMYSYAWFAGDNPVSKAWPGNTMTSTGKTNNGKTIYYVDYNIKYPNIKFDNNSSETSNLTLGSTNAGKMYNNGWGALAYDVTLNKDGGSGTGTTSIIATCGSAMPGSTTAPGTALSGYSFQGYYTAVGGGGTQYYTSAMASANNWPSNGSGPTTLYAKWTQTLNLNGNGATTAGTTIVTATYKGGITSISSNPSKTGYTFQGYYPNANGTGSQVINTSKALQKNVSSWTSNDATPKWIHASASTLYAKWTQTVTLDANTDNGGDEDGRVSAIYNGAISGYSAATAASGAYALEGYYTGTTSGDKVIDESGNIISGVTNWTDASGNWIHAGASTLYAHWKTTYSLKYDGNGKTGGSVPDDSEETMNSTVEAADPADYSLVRTGYTFTGWNDAPDGSGDLSVSAGGTFTIEDNTTLYAQWSENTVTLTPSVSYTGAASSHTVTGGGTIGITTTQTLTAAAAGTGYIFNGWTLSSNLVITNGTTSSLTITVRTTGDGAAVSAVAKYTEDLSTPLTLKGGSAFGGSSPWWNQNIALTKKSGFSTSSIAYATVNISSTNTGDANSAYHFKIYNGATAHGLAADGDQYWYSRAIATAGSPAGQQNLSTSGKPIELRADKAGDYEIKVDYSSTPYKITISFPGKAIVGSFNDWNGEANELISGVTTVNISETGEYEFKVYDGGIWWGNDGTIKASEASWIFSTGGSNCTLDATETGDYIFGWNNTNHELTVIYPSDQSKMKFTAQQYVYFDATGHTNWNASTFTTRFWFKHYATGEDLGGAVNCTDAMKLEGNVFYAQLPDNANVGQVQLNRMKPDLSELWCTANKVSGFDRTSANQNCMTKDPDNIKCSDWTPQWTTYCPPIATATLSNNGTVVSWGGNGSSATPYLVPTGSDIKVTAAFTQPITDPNMTTKYQFKAGASNDGSETTTNTHTFTASNTSGTKVAYSVVVRNHFNSATGTEAKDTIYFEARTPYSITYNPGEYGTGTIAGVTKLKGVNITLSSSTFSRTGYHQVGWATSDGGSKVYDAGDTYTEDAALNLYPVWEAQEYEVTLDPDNGNTTVKVGATYGSAMPTTKVGGGTLTAPTYAGYTFGGYWSGKNGTGTKYYDASAASAHTWDIAAVTTLYAQWTPNTLTFNATNDADWDDTGNWSEACLPTLEHPVVLAKAVEVNIATAKAKSVVIDQYNGRTGKLTVASNGALVVATTIKKLNASNEEVATEETDIILESDASGTGALVAGSASTDTKATVHFYTKAKIDGSGNYINQYFGIPMDSVSKLNYYGSYLQKFDQPNDAWKSFTSESKLGPWTAYRIMNDETSNQTYQITGKLLLPGTGAGKTKTLTVNTSTHNGDNMFANSWAAPIYIPAMVTNDETPDFSGVTATIYIYNAGSLSDYTYGSTYANKTASPGQWVCLPVKTVAGDKVNYLTVIPSQQAFLVQTSTGGSLTLDYKKHVYDPAVASGATIVPTYAPQRTQDNDLEKMRLYLAGESGASDRLMMYMREDFTSGFDDGWEGFKLPGSEFVPQLCAYSDAGEMSINAINDAEGTVLGFYAGTEDSEYTFTFGYEGNDVWYLNDLEAQQSTLIDAEHSYEFSAVPGTVAEHRFVISHTPIAHVPTGIDNSVAIEDVKARKQMINGILYIIRGGQLYSTDGQIVK